MAESKKTTVGNRLACDACGAEFKVCLGDLCHTYQREGNTNTWNYRYLECSQCGLMRIDPIPDWDVLLNFYDAEYGSYRQRGSPEQLAQSFKFQLARWRYADKDSFPPQPYWHRVLATGIEWLTGRTLTHCLGIPLQLPKDARILEVGYGNGEWLLAMRALGYTNLWGHDIESNSVVPVRLRAAGIQLTCGLFDDVELPIGTFDCVKLDHVLEHLTQPRKTLNKIYSLLKHGDLLAMAMPCNSRYSGSGVFPPLCYAHLDPPRHLFMHTRESLRRMLLEAGYKSIDLRVFPVSQVFWTSMNTWLKPHHVQLPNFFAHLFSPLYRLLGLGRWGECLTVRAVK